LISVWASVEPSLVLLIQEKYCDRDGLDSVAPGTISGAARSTGKNASAANPNAARMPRPGTGRRPLAVTEVAEVTEHRRRFIGIWFEC
jgi:hypothetical protein